MESTVTDISFCSRLILGTVSVKVLVNGGVCVLFIECYIFIRELHPIIKVTVMLSVPEALHNQLVSLELLSMTLLYVCSNVLSHNASECSNSNFSN